MITKILGSTYLKTKININGINITICTIREDGDCKFNFVNLSQSS